MSLFKIKRTGQLGFFSDKARPSYDMYHNKIYYFLKIVDPIKTDWEIASLPRYYVFTGDENRYSLSELTPINIKDLKKAQKQNSIDKLLAPETINESAEMAQSDITKIIDYSEKLQSMFNVNDNLEDWVKAKLNHACDYVATARDYLKFYRDERKSIDELLNEVKEIEKKYKNSDSVIDAIQYALDIVGLEPTIGSVADGTNAIISLLRAALEKEKDKKKQHLLNSAISGVSVIPFGDLAKLIKLRMLRKPTVKLLRLVKNYLKTSKPSYTDELFEKWSTKYKNSINCSNPKGFSQKAHCRARKLRQAGKHTSSKSVREIYKETINQLLKEFNSSMAMGALKQLNNDAKELETMLQPDTQLEDWVKAKLNLAGEYLDDVYHHLDHFGPDGRTLDEGWDNTKKYWFTPQGKVIDAGHSHEEWIKNNDRSLMGATLIDTYENAVSKGYVRGIHDIGSGFLTLSNLPNYDFSMSKINRSVKQAIEDFVVDKEIRLVATGKGKLIKDFEFSFAEQLELAEQILNSKKLEEGWKDWVAAGAIGLGALSGSPALASKQSVKPAITQQDSKLKSSELSLLNKKTSDYIGQWEGKRNTMYLDTEKKPTIGIGHYLTNTQQDRDLFNTLFGNAINYDLILKGKQKLTDDQIEKLFNVDVKVKEKLASKKISNFSSFPQYVKNAIINAFYRGDMGPKTIKLMNSGDWSAVAKEYLNHQNARSGPEQIQRRMKTNALAFAQYAKTKNEYFGFNYYF